MVITRKSRANLSTDDQGVASNNIADRQEREPLLSVVSEQPRPPLHPPPPPPAVAANSSRHDLRVHKTRNRLDDDKGNRMHVNGPEQTDIQYLQLRVATLNYPPSTDSQQLNKSKQQLSKNKIFHAPLIKQDIVRILIPSDGFASEKQLSDCLNHVCSAGDERNVDSLFDYTRDNGPWDSTEDFNRERRRSNIAGMFRESDGVFLPLSVIYSSPRLFVNDILNINRPALTEESRQINKQSIQGSVFNTLLEICGIIVVTIASWLTYSVSRSFDWYLIASKTESLFLALINLPLYIFDVIIEFPLRELYRHGPTFLGWEGESLAKICSRITHYGNEEFWARNMAECQEIYASKEAAAMQIRKPILIGFIVLILLYMVKTIVEAQAMRRQHLDPNTVETYKAITMLARQLNRAVNSN